ncbi:serine/threonine-protein kinase SRPK3 [Marchantia polymorpha subsp. ruderalis]|uniref:non-specific serine/threonine protein kinase n=1 Tax=Marchantia polymorpha TaxID=3197 RepID=A0A2R6XFQ0_MARPO|nr:hypothetical protein MARPO_0017s0028 [Marchantia polymorpha]|eukprot:PTQ44911.1 hypothetical protein MARPO_0017s0028 [Marchantia polymorpha]
MPRVMQFPMSSRSNTPNSGSSDVSESEEEGTSDYKRGGYHVVRIGDIFKAGRYIVHRKLGWGHFSTVWLAWDSFGKKYVALKVQKSAQHYTEAAVDEITILKQIADGDPENCKGVVRLLDHFKHCGPNGQHVCMVFELLGDNLLTLIKLYNYQGLPLDMVRQLAVHILGGLDFLHRHLSIIHTDLKPENVLLLSPLDPIKVPQLSEKLEYSASFTERRVSCAPPGTEELCKSSITGLSRNQKKKLKRRAKKAACSEKLVLAGGRAAVDDENGGCLGDRRPVGSPVLKATARSDNLCAGSSKHDDLLTDISRPLELAQGTKENASFLLRSERKRSDFADQGARKSTDVSLKTATLQQPGDLRQLDLRCKIVDLGNACWSYKQFTSDIQTRQYRCPEVLLGSKYTESADMWSFACIVFELATGDVLFDPRSGDDFDRDEDHLALMMELLGRMPRKVALGGRYSRDYFNRHGELRHIRKLRYWPLDGVLVEKYDFTKHDAEELAMFLRPLLDFIPEKRPTAQQCLLHSWLRAAPTYAEARVVSDVGSGDTTGSQEAVDRAEVAMSNIAILSSQDEDNADTPTACSEVKFCVEAGD